MITTLMLSESTSYFISYLRETLSAVCQKRPRQSLPFSPPRRFCYRTGAGNGHERLPVSTSVFPPLKRRIGVSSFGVRVNFAVSSTVS